MPQLDTNNPPPEPWHSFFKELDAIASEETFLQCVGGFVVTRLYGLPRATADIDVLSIVPSEQGRELLARAQQGSELAKKYGVHLQYVGGIVSLPSDYEDRLVEMYPGVYNHLRFFALDPYDLALSKLSRNAVRDREDVLYVDRTVPLDLEILKTRYTKELRPFIVGRPESHDTTLELWLEMIREDRAKRSV